MPKVTQQWGVGPESAWRPRTTEGMEAFRERSAKPVEAGITSRPRPRWSLKPVPGVTLADTARNPRGPRDLAVW